MSFDCSMLNLHFHTFLRSLHPEHGSEYLRLFASSRMTDCNTGIAAEYKNFL